MAGKQPPPRSTPRNHLAQGDCLALMAGWPGASVDLIFAAPPFTFNRQGIERGNPKKKAEPDRSPHLRKRKQNKPVRTT